MNPTIAIITGAVGLLVGLVSLLAVAVQLGRVLQRQDTSDAANKVRDESIKTLQESKHDHTAAMQLQASRIEILSSNHSRSESDLHSLHSQFADVQRGLAALREDLVGRLIRIEMAVEHHSVPSPQPSAGGFRRTTESNPLTPTR